MKEALSFILTGGLLINSINFLTYLKKSGKSLQDRILLAIFLLLILVVANYYAGLHSMDILTVITFIPNEMAEWVISPLLYLFVLTLFRNPKDIKGHFWRLSIIPVLILCTITLPFMVYIFVPEWGLPHIRFLVEHPYLYVFSSALYNLFILVLSLSTISDGTKKQGHFYSVKRTDEYIWLQLFIVALILVFVLDSALECYELFIQELTWDSSYLIICILILFITYLFYFGTHHSKILLPDFIWNEVSQEHTAVRQDTELEKKLIQEMKEHAFFLSPELTLSELAERMGTTDKKLSELLNKQMSTNFYEFVNEYRLNHFEQLALSFELQQKTIFGLAQESGFKSKTTFNRLFKKKHGMTPNEFIKKRHK